MPVRLNTVGMEGPGKKTSRASLQPWPRGDGDVAVSGRGSLLLRRMGRTSDVRGEGCSCIELVFNSTFQAGVGQLRKETQW